MVSTDPADMFSRPKPRRRILACDFCRRKKSRCNGYEMSGNRCTNCMVYNVDCTYASKNPPKGYVEDLEKRIALMEKILKQHSPDVDLERILQSMDNLEEDIPISPTRPKEAHPPPDFTPIPVPRPTFDDEDDRDPQESDDDDFVTVTGAGRGYKLPVIGRTIFFGKSSHVFFSRDAVQMRQTMTGIPEDEGPSLITEASRRPQFWKTPDWMLPTLRPKENEYRFPEHDLLLHLVDRYFQFMNIFVPLLHRPTFENSIAEGVHLSDEGFGATVLLACAIGCRFSHDPRVILEITEEAPSTSWDLFHQVGRLLRPPFLPESIYDLQVYPLAAIFLESSTTPQAPWRIIGTGLRFALEAGAHRRKMYGPEPTIESEMWKRAFWVLLVLDRLTCSTIGRPCGLQDADFDVELPVECDDEYWYHPDPTQAFKQPKEKPSKLTFFIWLIKLNQILAFALRTIYSIKKSRIIMGYEGDKWESSIVAELDDALSKWEHSVPAFLRWDPNRGQSWAFRQSAVLRCHYYELQMIIHRPFVQSRKPSALSSSSLLICTQAARSCSHIVNDFRERLRYSLHHLVPCIFTCAILLVIKAWSGVKTDPLIFAEEMNEVDRCLDMLNIMRMRWVMAGRFRDVLVTIIHAADIPTRRTKRSHLFSATIVAVGPTTSPRASSQEDSMGGSPKNLPSSPSSDHTASTQEGFPAQLAQLFFAANSPPPVPYSSTTHAKQASTSMFPAPPQDAPWNTGPPAIPEATISPAEQLLYNDMISDFARTVTNPSNNPFGDFPADDSRGIPIPPALQALAQHVCGKDCDAHPAPMPQQTARPAPAENSNGKWATAPSRLEGWEDWATYANYLHQKQDSARFQS